MKTSGWFTCCIGYKILAYTSCNYMNVWVYVPRIVLPQWHQLIKLPLSPP